MNGNFSAEKGSHERTRFDGLMREAGPKIYALSVRLTGNASDGQDLAQETFVSAFRHFKNFREEAAFGTWVYRICVNTWKNRVRFEKRRFFWCHFSIDSKEQDDALPLDLPSPDPAPDRSLEEAERSRLVSQALGRLGSEDRAIVLLREAEDKTYEEIAVLLDLPLGTVKSRLARARERLRPFLENAV